MGRHVGTVSLGIGLVARSRRGWSSVLHLSLSDVSGSASARGGVQSVQRRYAPPLVACVCVRRAGVGGGGRSPQARPNQTEHVKT